MEKIIKLTISLIIPLLIGFLGSFFTTSSVNSWYTTINKPFFNPPNWIFAPVWTVLFILIGLSFYYVWINNFDNQKYKVISIYYAQLFLNLLWSILFFGMRSPLFSLIEIIILCVVIVFNILIFYKVSKKAGLLLLPYLFWVIFASFLNFSIYMLN